MNTFSSGQNCRGAVQSLFDKWINGTENIKKSNAVDHISKSSLHRKAVYALSKSTSSSDTPSDSANENSYSDLSSASYSTPCSTQTTLPQLASKITQSEKEKLIKKLQLVHFLVNKCKPFQDYEDFIKYEKDVHKINIGSGYLNRQAASIMTSFVAKHIRKMRITDPLNKRDSIYFSLFYDGSSSAKTMDEKELYVIKTCQEGRPHFQVASLEEPANTDAAGLKQSLQNSIDKMNFTFDRKTRQVENGSDGAAVNKALFKDEQDELGPHLINGWCANHKCELGIHDAYKDSILNKESETIMANIYGLFKKANLKWCLFKRQAQFMGLKHLKYHRVTGTRWTSHQVDCSSNFLRNLPILLGFLHQQTSSPHNKTMKDAKASLIGHLKGVSRLDVIFLAVRQDILAYVSPFSQALEGRSLLVPSALTAMKCAIQTIHKISVILEEKGTASFYLEEMFPTFVNHVFPHLENDSSGGDLPVRRTRHDGDAEEIELDGIHQTFYGYSFKTSLDAALKKVMILVFSICYINRNIILFIDYII